MQILENTTTIQHYSKETQNLDLHEYHKPSINRNTTKNKTSEEIVQDEDYEQIETYQGEMKIILGFPKKSNDTSSIKEDVKSTLMNILYEQFQHIQKGEFNQ